MAEENFLIKTIGGPYDGETRTVPRSVLGWPPPANLPGIFHGGIYILVDFSKLPKTSVVRDATYEWRDS